MGLLPLLLVWYKLLLGFVSCNYCVTGTVMSWFFAFLDQWIFMLFSFCIIYLLQFAISSGIITACTMNNIFKYSDKTLVFAYFFVFGLSAIMLSFFISTFFKRAKTAVAVGTLSFLGAFFPYYTVNDEGVSMWVLALPITNIFVVHIFLFGM